MTEGPAAGQPRAHWTALLSPEERAAQLARDEKLVQRDVRKAFFGTLLGCVVSLAAGLCLMGLGVHLRDAETGQIAFLAGLLVGYTGIVVTIARYYLRGEQEGWW